MRKSEVPSVSLRSIEAGAAFPVIPAMNSFLPVLKQQTILSFAQLKDGVAIWKFDDRGIVSKWSSFPAGQAEKAAERFERECADPQSDLSLLRTEARRLYDMLVAPIAESLQPGRVLVIEGDGTLERIPFQALLTPSGDFLGQRFSIVYSSSAGYGKVHATGGTLHRHMQALIVSAPAMGEEVAGLFPALPDASKEAEAVAARFDHALLLEGKEATPLALERDLVQAEVFHFAGHTIASGEGGALVLASAGPKHSTEVFSAEKLKLKTLRRCRLVVLSACSTGVNSFDRYGVGSLVGTLLRSGVRLVVASGWDVDSGATRDFMSTFYQALVNGQPAPTALQVAAGRLASRKDTAHPYYWAAFRVYGG
jgi:CHAT domain-containing protein